MRDQSGGAYDVIQYIKIYCIELAVETGINKYVNGKNIDSKNIFIYMWELNGKAIRCCLKAVFYDRVCVCVCVCVCACTSIREDRNAEGLLEPLGIFPTGNSGFHHLSQVFSVVFSS